MIKSYHTVRGKFSVNIKMNNFVGNILQKKVLRRLLRFAIRYTPLKPMHTFLLQRCYAILGATGTETSLKLTAYCIEYSSPYPRCRWALHSQ